ncbi:hypothetical protein Ancab_002912 [Ancistrocladus abbreviatus]
MKEAEMSIPELFRCPISLDLFTDPVTLCTGQTYDRPSIQRWLAAGNLTCPVTMQKLHDLSMVPNHTLRHLIHRWLQSAHQPNPEATQSGLVIRELKHKLEAKNTTLEQKLQALKQIRVLLEEFPDKSQSFIQLGIFQLLLELAFGAKGELSQEMLLLVEEALYCAVKLEPFCELRCLNCVLNEKPKLASLVMLLEEGTALVKKSLCQLMQAMAISSSSIEVKEVSIIRGLINLLDHEQDFNVCGSGISAILALCSTWSSTLPVLVKEGAIDSVIAYILRAQRVKEKNWAGQATRAVELMLSVEIGKEFFLTRNRSNGVRALVKMVFRVCDEYHEGSESAVNSLIILCCDSKEARDEAIIGGVLSQLLLLLQSQCSVRCKAKARMLLKLLGCVWAKDPKAFVSM